MVTEDPERAGPEPADTSAVFDHLDRYLAVPRVTGLVLSPDGHRLVCSAQTIAPDRKSYITSLWELDPAGAAAPRRLTWSAEGEKNPAFLPDGDLVFVSKRPAGAASPQAGGRAPGTAALWLLPAVGGESRPVLTLPSDIDRVLVARRSGQVFVTCRVLPGVYTGDEERRQARGDAGVSAILHESAPVRHWDHDVGPDHPRLLAVEPAGTSLRDGSAEHSARDLTPTPGRALEDVGIAVSDDGSLVLAGWRTPLGRGFEGQALVSVDTETGERVVLAQQFDRPDKHSFDHPAISPDRRYAVCVDEREGDTERPPTMTLRLFDLARGDSRDLLPGFPLWPAAPTFSADGASVFFVADERGRRPLFRVDVESGAVARLAADGSYSEVQVAPDGRHVFALRSRIDAPPTPVRVDVDAVDQTPPALPAPGAIGAVPGRVDEVEVERPDGARVRGWLVLPETASAAQPAPLALWVHGGPLMSWDSWSWRWNPWLLATRGWAVLLPDPALSQGYGDAFIERAWQQWGPVPFGDLMAITDETVARPDIDESRTAAMGGSYGGYMANWIAGHTDRFKAVVTHASLWNLEQFVGVTDHSGEWMQEWGHPLTRPERYELNSPHRHVASVRTPMLVVHGDKDYRVPIAEGLRLWSDLLWHGVDAKFLYFPDEHHWILGPGNAKVWYETVFAFLDHHVLGRPWSRPELL